MILKIYLVRNPKKDDSKKPEPSGDPTKEGPPETTRPAQSDESKIKKGLDIVFWLRVGLGVLAGTLSAIIGSPMEHHRGFLALGIVIIIFIISYAIAKSLRVPLPPSDKRKLIMTGIGSYFLMFLFSWILVNTLIHPDVGIQSIR